MSWLKEFIFDIVVWLMCCLFNSGLQFPLLIEIPHLFIYIVHILHLILLHTGALWIIYFSYIFGLCTWFLTCRSQNSWNFLSAESNRGAFCYVNEVGFGKYLRIRLVAKRTNSVIRGLELPIPSPDLSGGDCLRLNQLPVASDVMNHISAMKLP